MTTLNLTPILKKSSKVPYKNKLNSTNTSHGAETGAPSPESASLSHLKEENSHLLKQSYRLISDLESTSHQLLEANSQIHDLRGKLDSEGTDSSKDRVTAFDTQLKFMEEENAQRSPQCTTSHREREEEWTSNHEALKGHLNTLQFDLRKLRDSTNYRPTTTSQVSASSINTQVTAAQTTKATLTITDSSSRLLSQPSYTFSSCSPTQITSTTTTSTPSERSRGCSSRYCSKPVVGGSVTFDPSIIQRADDILSRQSVLATPLANSTLLSSSHLSGSSSSLSSIQSSQSAREYSSRLQNRRYTSYRPKHHYTPHVTSSRESEVKPRYNSRNESSTPRTLSDTRPHNPLPSQQGVNSYYTSNIHQSSHKGVINHHPSGQHKALSGSEKVNSSSSSSSAGYSSWQSATNSQSPATHQVKEVVTTSSRSRYEPSLSTYGRPGNSYRSSVLPNDNQTPPTVNNTNGDGANQSADSGASSSSHLLSSPRTRLSVSSEKLAPVSGSRLSVRSPVSVRSSVTDGDLSARVELERAHSKIKQLEKEVDLLEKQLTDKTQSAKHHVEELMEMRMGLAQERSSLAILKQEIKNSATEEMNRTQAVHSHRCTEFQNQLETLKNEKMVLQRQVDSLNTSLEGSQSECSSLSQRLASIQSQQQQEKISFSEAMQLLQKEVKDGCERVTQLEHALEICGNELTGHLTQVEKSVQQYRSDIELLRNQVESLSADLNQSDEKLLRKTELATNLQQELTDTRSEFQRETSSWRQRESEMRHSLDQSELLRQSLSKRIERLNGEIKDCSSRLSQQGEMSNEILYARSDIHHLKNIVEELEGKLERTKRDCLEANEKEQRLTFELTQEQHKEDELIRKLEHSNVLFQEEVRKREEAETNVAQLKDNLERLGKECDGCRTRVKEAESRAKQREEEMESELGHMQQELAKRAQQVLEMDELLRTHQANTAARRLQLERLLTQRQADIRSRTQELEDVMIKYNETKQREVVLKQEVDRLKSSEQSLTSQKCQELSSKESKLSSLERQLKEVESVGVVRAKELGEELRLIKCREKVSREKSVELETLVAELTKENDSLRKQHSNQVKRLQETHSTLLSSHEQQSTSHRLQLQELFDQEKTRQEELSRCRAQVASLSAELAAERQVSDAARRQVAMKRAECAKYQALVSNVQRTHSGSSPLSSTDGALETTVPSSIDYSSTQPRRFPSHALQTSDFISHNTPQPLDSHSNMKQELPSRQTEGLPLLMNSALGRSSSLPTVQGKLNVFSELGQGVTRDVSRVDFGTDQSRNFTPIFPKTKFKGDIVNI